MDLILFDCLPPIVLLLVACATVYYGVNILYSITEEAKDAKTLTDVVLCIVASLIISILLIVMVALSIEAIV